MTAMRIREVHYNSIEVIVLSCSVLRCVACVACVLQCVAVCCSVQCVAVCCSVQCVAVYCSVQGAVYCRMDINADCYLYDLYR